MRKAQVLALLSVSILVSLFAAVVSAEPKDIIRLDLPDKVAVKRTLLFDQYHGNFDPLYRYVKIPNALAAENWEIRIANGPITPDMLADVDVLYINEPYPEKLPWYDTTGASYASGEIEAIRNFVASGGGFFMANDFTPYVKDLQAPYGIENNQSDRVWIWHMPVYNITAHPITESLSLFYYNCGSTLRLEDSAWIPLAFWDNKPVLACREYGSGRVVMIGDNDMFIDTYCGQGVYDVTAENVRLFVDIVNWLSNKEYGIQWLPPVSVKDWFNAGSTIPLKFAIYGGNTFTRMSGLKVGIYDNDGGLVREYSGQDLKIGEHDLVNFSTKGLSSGTYRIDIRL